MDNMSLIEKLNHLITQGENEVVEFKEANDNFPTDQIGRYFSALSNEANLRNIEGAWLIFGVKDTSRSIVGTDYRTEPNRLQGTKLQIAQDTEPSIPFRNIFEVQHPKGRVILFEVPPAPLGIPIAWKGHYYSRSGESLFPLTLDKLDEIRGQTLLSDWSAQTAAQADLSHLDESAVNQARDSFARKYENRFASEIVLGWPLESFLDRAKLTQNGRVTRAALLLLGKPESSYLLSPHPVQLTWKLVGPEKSYMHWGPPFLLTSTSVYNQIRNTQLKILPDNQLLPIEVSKYDQRIVLEALHNCIAHQDYSRNGRIIVTEYPDKLVFENEGGFFEGVPDDYIKGEKTPRRYRNPFLAQAMTELNMIDTMGYGIHEIHLGQAKRFFPMPDYELDDTNSVKLTIHGQVLDPAYTQRLIQSTDLELEIILALDRVQKNLPITDYWIRKLRKQGLIEGRKPNLHVSAYIADAAEGKSQDNNHYADLVMDYIRQFGKASRDEIDKLLSNKLSDNLDQQQKRIKIANILTNMRRTGKITNRGSRKHPEWVFKGPNAE